MEDYCWTIWNFFFLFLFEFFRLHSFAFELHNSHETSDTNCWKSTIVCIVWSGDSGTSTIKPFVYKCTGWQKKIIINFGVGNRVAVAVRWDRCCNIANARTRTQLCCLLYDDLYIHTGVCVCVPASLYVEYHHTWANRSCWWSFCSYFLFHTETSESLRFHGVNCANWKAHAAAAAACWWWRVSKMIVGRPSTSTSSRTTDHDEYLMASFSFFVIVFGKCGPVVVAVGCRWGATSTK